MAPTIASLYRYPVKGLSPERLDHADLVAGAYFPGDRLYAIENGPSGFDPGRPAHLPKIHFLMLMRNERLARLRTSYDPGACRLTIVLDGRCVCDADLADAAGRQAVRDFLAGFCADELRGEPTLFAAREGFSFTDSRKGFVSLVNLASVQAVEATIGRPVDPLRFRANIYVDGAEAWVENTLVGRRLKVGDTVLEIVSTTERCAATGVDPQSGERDMNVVATLMRRFRHNLCGVYASIVQGGRIRPGDRLDLVPAE